MSEGVFKDYPMNIKMPGDLRADIERVAAELHISPPGLARALMEEYVKARLAHGADVAWPPLFMRRTGAMIAANASAEPEKAVPSTPLIYARAAHPPAHAADRPAPTRAKPRG